LITSLRTAKNLDRAALAAKLEISKDYLGLIERDKPAHVSERVAKALAQILDISGDGLQLLVEKANQANKTYEAERKATRALITKAVVKKPAKAKASRKATSVELENGPHPDDPITYAKAKKPAVSLVKPQIPTTEELVAHAITVPTDKRPRRSPSIAVLVERSFLESIANALEDGFENDADIHGAIEELRERARRK
jgi:transcriptional regulator with XRE-family HTH domain